IRGAATACSRRLLAALDLRCLAARLHSCAARRRAGLASGHAINVTTGHPLMQPSHDGQNQARNSERYHTHTDVERGLNRGVRERERNALFSVAYVRDGVMQRLKGGVQTRDPHSLYRGVLDRIAWRTRYL